MDRLIGKKELSRILLRSSTQLDRDEQAGRLPKRYRCGPHRTSRIGWWESEILKLVEEMKTGRQTPTDCSSQKEE